MKTIRLLIVDDSPQVRQDLHTALSLAGQAAHLQIEIVAEACDGAEAIQLAMSTQPEVILMDLEMPVKDGYSATQAIKSANPAIRVVSLSIHSDLESREKASRAGVDIFLEKGVSLAEIISALQSEKRRNCK